MGVEFRLALVLLVASIAVVNISVLAQLSVVESFESYDIVPDVIFTAPKCEAIVNYPGGVRVHLGKELTPTQVKDIPTVDYDASPDDFYTLVFVDPDVPSRDDPVLRELEHWLVVNIPGNNVNSGETIAEYIGSAPQNGTGLHRYVFLIYQQQGLLTFDEPRLNKTSGYARAQFSTARFAEKYNLGDPVAGNFYQAQYDDYVPILSKQLGIHNYVPDVFSAPEYEVIVNYPGEDRIHLDNELTLTQVKDIPTVDYDASPEVFYTPEFVADSEMSDVARAFIDHEVVPDVILVAPKFDAEFKFPSGVQANLGNEVTPTQVKDMPTTLWKTSPNTFYTLIMTGPDAPSRAKPRIREWQHWLVGNIPGNNVDAGETLTEFVSSGPYLGTGIHRHVFLVYEQPGRIQYDVPRLNNTSAANRSYFSTVDFARRYNLGEPIAGNFYQAQYDDIVPSIFARLGLDPASIL